MFWKAIVSGLPAGPATSGVVNWVASATIETSPFGAGAFDGAEPPDPLPGPAAAPGAGEPAAAVVEVLGGSTPDWMTTAAPTRITKSASVPIGKAGAGGGG